MHKERKTSSTVRNISAAAKILPEKGVAEQKKNKSAVSLLMQVNSIDSLPNITADNCFNVQQNRGYRETQTPRPTSLDVIPSLRDPSVTGFKRID